MENLDSYETLKKLMLERRSVRKYLDQEIPAEELKEVLELAQVFSVISNSYLESSFIL